jgi:hypothetical protein
LLDTRLSVALCATIFPCLEVNFSPFWLAFLAMFGPLVDLVGRLGMAENTSPRRLFEAFLSRIAHGDLPGAFTE